MARRTRIGPKLPPISQPKAPAIPKIPSRPVDPRIQPFPRRPGRGGRRPGAGAPRGNTNALKHGVYSKRLQLATLILAAVPELRVLFKAFADKSKPRTPTLRRAIADAARIVIADPQLAGSIRELVNKRFLEAMDQIRPPDPSRKIS
jgi:hypothetical protein